MSDQPAPQPPKPVPHGVEHQVAMRELADVISSIRPDPKYARNCHQSNCNGKRGYHAISCYITEDGKKHYQVEMCCGMVGESEYTRIRKTLEEGLQRIERAIGQ